MLTTILTMRLWLFKTNTRKINYAGVIMNNKVKVSIALVFSSLAISAHAGFIENAQPVSSGGRGGSYVHAPVQSAGVSQVGNPSSAQPYVRGFANEVSLLTALKQIVPIGWHAKRVGQIDTQMSVSWRGNNRVWLSVLDQLAQENGFVATVNWNTKELTVEPAGQSQSNRVISEVRAPSEWVLRPEMTLKENVTEWARNAGWTVSWGSVDYPVTNTVVFQGGEIDADNGPLHQLVEAYKTAEQPLVVSFWTNRVIRIENASYQQVPAKDEMPNHRALR